MNAPTPNEDIFRAKVRELTRLWAEALILQRSTDGTKHRDGDRLHMQALALENELVEMLAPPREPGECPHCRAAYEVYAGADGFHPGTAAEGYQQRIIEQMRDAVMGGLSAPPPAGYTGLGRWQCVIHGDVFTGRTCPRCDAQPVETPAVPGSAGELLGCKCIMCEYHRSAEAIERGRRAETTPEVQS
jgi:hypothetical protein